MNHKPVMDHGEISLYLTTFGHQLLKQSTLSQNNTKR